MWKDEMKCFFIKTPGAVELFMHIRQEYKMKSE